MTYLEFLKEVMAALSILPQVVVGSFLPPHTEPPAVGVTLTHVDASFAATSVCLSLVLTFWIKSHSPQELKELQEKTLGLLKNLGAIKMSEESELKDYGARGITQRLEIKLFKLLTL